MVSGLGGSGAVLGGWSWVWAALGRQILASLTKMHDPCRGFGGPGPPQGGPERPLSRIWGARNAARHFRATSVEDLGRQDRQYKPIKTLNTASRRSGSLPRMRTDSWGLTHAHSRCHPQPTRAHPLSPPHLHSPSSLSVWVSRRWFWVSRRSRSTLAKFRRAPRRLAAARGSNLGSIPRRPRLNLARAAQPGLSSQASLG